MATDFRLFWLTTKMSIFYTMILAFSLSCGNAADDRNLQRPSTCNCTRLIDRLARATDNVINKAADYVPDVAIDCVAAFDPDTPLGRAVDIRKGLVAFLGLNTGLCATLAIVE